MLMKLEKSKTFLSPIFEDTVKVYEGQTEWKIPISITGRCASKTPGKAVLFLWKQ